MANVRILKNNGLVPGSKTEYYVDVALENGEVRTGWRWDTQRDTVISSGGVEYGTVTNFTTPHTDSADSGQRPIEDTDKDGRPNRTDADDDGDGVPDVRDAFPLDKTKQYAGPGEGANITSSSPEDKINAPAEGRPNPTPKGEVIDGGSPIPKNQADQTNSNSNTSNTGNSNNGGGGSLSGPSGPPTVNRDTEPDSVPDASLKGATVLGQTNQGWGAASDFAKYGEPGQGSDVQRPAGTGDDATPEIYTGGAKPTDKSYSFTDKLGRENTITITESGAVIQQVEGGNPYRINREDAEKVLESKGIDINDSVYTEQNIGTPVTDPEVTAQYGWGASNVTNELISPNPRKELTDNDTRSAPTAQSQETYEPTNPGWGNAGSSTSSDPQTSDVYQPTNPGWGNSVPEAKEHNDARTLTGNPGVWGTAGGNPDTIVVSGTGPTPPDVLNPAPQSQPAPTTKWGNMNADQIEQAINNSSAGHSATLPNNPDTNQQILDTTDGDSNTYRPGVQLDI